MTDVPDLLREDLTPYHALGMFEIPEVAPSSSQQTAYQPQYGPTIPDLRAQQQGSLLMNTLPSSWHHFLAPAGEAGQPHSQPHSAEQGSAAMHAARAEGKAASTSKQEAKQERVREKNRFAVCMKEDASALPELLTPGHHPQLC